MLCNLRGVSRLILEVVVPDFDLCFHYVHYSRSRQVYPGSGARSGAERRRTARQDRQDILRQTRRKLDLSLHVRAHSPLYLCSRP